MARLIGYARVSTTDQNLDLQIDALIKAGCDERDIFTDKAKGTLTDRTGLNKALEQVRKNDTLVVWRIDRLGRSLKHLIEIVTKLDKQGVSFKSTEESSMDTTTSAGKMFFGLFAVLAEFERNLIRERTQAGLAAARARGRLGGRPKKLDSHQIKLIIEMYDKREKSVPDICKLMKISKPTLYAYVKSNEKRSLA
ncbi:hypothetical protein DID80_01665 [Candidatus Marinamargulisbacteria bacterium SCGC AAA071-K20]|nr:hypothetical protein DID80_01665 [Candidatus Marinamargulisbacteria bacterium SCGC AAA071-K20]